MCTSGFVQCKKKKCDENYKCFKGVCVMQECKANELLIGNKCVTNFVCNQLKPCPDNLKCINGLCEDKPCPAYTCPQMTQCIEDRCVPIMCGNNRDCKNLKCDIVNRICTDVCYGNTCPDGFICVKEMCYPYTICTVVTECPQGEFCDLDNQFCVPADCFDDIHCSNALPHCVNGICTAKTYICKSDLDCNGLDKNRNYACINGTCSPFESCKPACPRNKICSPLSNRCIPQYSCSTICPNGMECDSVTKECKEKSCKEEADCPEGRACIKGICSIPEECRCKSNEKCIANQCYSKCSPKCECNHDICLTESCDDKCKFGKYCLKKFDKCSPPECYSKTDCGQYELCVFGRCTKEVVNHCDKCEPKEICRWNRCLPESFTVCYKDEDCADGYSCDKGICYPNNNCRKDIDCSFPTKCIYGTCRIENTWECSNDLELVEGKICLPPTVCRSAQDCPGNELCISGKCLAQCKKNTDCKKGYFCNIFNVCDKRVSCDKCADLQLCHNEYCHTTRCSYNEECPLQFPICYLGKCRRHYSCSQTLCSKCINDMCMDGCKNCKEWEECFQDTCYPKDIICKNKNVCPIGLECKSGKCKPCTGSSCSMPAPCDSCRENEKCYNGKCTIVCNEHNDCPNGYCFVDGICGEIIKCQCKVGEICLDTQCIAPECFTDYDCRDPGICLYGYCVYERKNICFHKLDCPRNEECKNGRCTPTECKCKKPETCYMNQCFLATICYTDDDCPNGMSCDENTETCTLRSCLADTDCRSGKLECSKHNFICTLKVGCKPQCKPDELCNNVSGECEKETCFNNLKSSEPCPADCTKVRCPSNQKCKEGKCVQIFNCIDIPCPAPQICREYRNKYYCVNPQCRGDFDCPIDKYCTQGKCTPPCTGECENGLTCNNGICKTHLKCPCPPNYYCGSDYMCYPKRRCNPLFNYCTRKEECLCSPYGCYCSEIICKDAPEKCKSPEICDPTLETCVQSSMCTVKEDCKSDYCCNTLISRCVPCCEYESDCIRGQKCLRGMCTTIDSTHSFIPECLKNQDCPGGVCFYGICSKNPKKCDKADSECDICFKNVCIKYTSIDIYTRTIAIIRELKDINNTDVFNNTIEIPGNRDFNWTITLSFYTIIHCQYDSYCPIYTKCGKERHCQRIVCQKDEDCVDGDCIETWCVPKPICLSKKDCKQNEICVDGECKEICNEEKSKCTSGECQLLWGNKGICTIHKKCKTHMDCPFGKRCESEDCKIMTKSCPRGTSLIAGECVTNIVCKTDEDCPKGHLCHQEFKMCLIIPVCAENQCNPSQDCVKDKCIYTIRCSSNLDCPKEMECIYDLDGKICKFKKCNTESCLLPYNRCYADNQGRSICLPTPICKQDADCPRNEKCIREKCLQICTKNCNDGYCINNICYPPTSCNEYSCEPGENCQFPIERCRKLECNSDMDCPFSRAKCLMGKCINSFTPCNNKRECPLGSYCQKYDKNFGSVCIPIPPCDNGKCSKGSICNVKSNSCIPIIVCRYDHDCPTNMICTTYAESGRRICQPTECKSEKDCEGICTDLQICGPTVIHITCWTKEDCKVLKGDYDCVYGQCSITQCLTKLNNLKIIESECPPVCSGPADCPEKEICLDGYCQRRDTCECKKENEVCFNSKCIDVNTVCKSNEDCPSSDVCRDGKCENLKPCYNDVCPCNYDQSDNCPIICTDTAAFCPYSGMICKNRECIRPVCIRDSECHGWYCVDGQCQEHKECLQHSSTCYCVKGVCFSEPLCPYCPDAYECIESKFCVPVGIKCFSEQHCPEHMKCVDGQCIFISCRSNVDCSYSRKCVSTGSISVCLPNPREPCLKKKSGDCIECEHSFHCPMYGMICKNNVCIFQVSCTNCKNDEICENGQCSKKCKEKCKPKESCDNGKCVKVIIEISCFIDSHCPTPSFCDKESKQCTNICSPKRPCPENFNCEDSYCVYRPPNPICIYENECTPKTYCDIALNECKPFCNKDSDCLAEEKCIEGKCKPPEDSCSKCPELHRCIKDKCVKVSCLSHKCPSGQVCNYGYCVPTTVCLSDNECPFGYKCIGGEEKVCVPFIVCKGNKCENHETCQNTGDVSVCTPDIICKSRCPIGMECNKKVCKPSCDNKVCKLTEYCINQKCVPFNKVGGCKDSFDCPRKHLCKTGKCVPKECTQDSDCANYNEVCVNCKCLPKICYSHHDCTKYPYTFCDDNGQCVTEQCKDLNLELVDNKCMPILCDTDPCPPPYICKNNKCKLCTSNTDCPNGKICKNINGALSKCEIEIIICNEFGQSCSKDQRCWDGQCYDKCSCKLDNECGLNMECTSVSKGECACIPNCSGRCTEISQHCLDNKCYFPECLRDFDCPGNEYCSGGYCTSVIECKRKEECPHISYDCIKGVCLLEISCSTKNVKCQTGKNCKGYDKEKLCLPEGISCYSRKHCPEMMDCINSLCQLLVCDDDLQCGSSYPKLRECKDGLCIPKVPCNGKSCKSCNKIKCSKGYSCVNGQCQVNVQVIFLNINFITGVFFRKISASSQLCLSMEYAQCLNVTHIQTVIIMNFVRTENVG